MYAIRSYYELGELVVSGGADEQFVKLAVDAEEGLDVTLAGELLELLVDRLELLDLLLRHLERRHARREPLEHALDRVEFLDVARNNFV